MEYTLVIEKKTNFDLKLLEISKNKGYFDY